MKPKTMLLFSLCVLLLLGCMGCGKTVAIPKLNPVVLSSADADKIEYGFNISVESLLKSFHLYSQDKGVLPLENGEVFKDCPEPSFFTTTYLLLDPQINASENVFISFVSSSKTKRISSVFIWAQTPNTEDQAKKTCDIFLDFLLEVFETEDQEQLKAELFIYSSDEKVLKNAYGKYTSITYKREPGLYTFLILPKQ